ncbi:MAG: CHAD domain-containing protein [Gammaproteobacteria bacterium]|nr:MAG: CHAD domain-containing protein [Gammaproteobacteria bacterium]
MNCLEKYRSKLIRDINHNLGIIVERPDEDPVHDFRVGIKRLTALYYLLAEIKPELNARHLLKPYRVAFKLIGEIRDIHIAEHLIASLDEINPQDSAALIKALRLKSRRDYRLFQQSVPADHRLSIRVPTIKSIGLSERRINRQKPVILARLLSQIITTKDKMTASSWHKKRILLKRYHHVLDAFCYCPGHSFDESELKQIRILEQLLGDWHDRVITADLIESLPSMESKRRSTIAIMEKQDKLLLGAAKIYLKKFALRHRQP